LEFCVLNCGEVLEKVQPFELSRGRGKEHIVSRGGTEVRAVTEQGESNEHLLWYLKRMLGAAVTLQALEHLPLDGAEGEAPHRD
jgi:hypothetical protein